MLDISICLKAKQVISRVYSISSHAGVRSIELTPLTGIEFLKKTINFYYYKYCLTAVHKYYLIFTTLQLNAEEDLTDGRLRVPISKSSLHVSLTPKPIQSCSAPVAKD